MRCVKCGMEFVTGTHHICLAANVGSITSVTVSCADCGAIYNPALVQHVCIRRRVPDVHDKLQMALRGLLEVIDRELEKSGCDRSDLPQSSQTKIKAAQDALG